MKKTIEIKTLPNLSQMNSTKSTVHDKLLPSIKKSVDSTLGRFVKQLTNKINKDFNKILVDQEIDHALYARHILDSFSEEMVNFQNEDHIILDCNKAFCDLLGLTKEEIIGKRCTEIFCTEGGCIDNCPIERVKNGNRTVYSKIIDDKYLEKTADPVYDSMGNLLGYVEIYRDRTEIYKYQKQIEKTNEILTSALENSRQGIWEWNMQTGEVEADESFMKMLGLNPNKTKFNYKMWEKILHPEDKNIVMEEIEKNLRGMQDYFQFTYRLKHKKGHYVWLTATGKITEVDMKNNPIKAIGTHMDITEVTNIKNFMVANEQKLHAIIASIPDLLLVLDKDGNYKELYSGNPNYFIGNRKEGSNVNIIFDKKNAKGVMDTIKKTLETKETQQLEYELKGKEETHYFSGSFQALDDNNVVIITRDISEQKRLELEKDEYKKKLEYLALNDSLTGIPGRAYFYEELDRLINLSSRINKKLAIMFIDLDGFKQINDTYGHGIGDLLLKEVAQRFKLVSRESDFIARLGGDEFGVIMTNVENKEDYEKLALRILEEIKKEIVINDIKVSIGCSIGISLFPDHATNIEDLLRYADSSMYRVKGASKNNFKVFEHSR